MPTMGGSERMSPEEAATVVWIGSVLQDSPRGPAPGGITHKAYVAILGELGRLPHDSGRRVLMGLRHAAEVNPLVRQFLVQVAIEFAVMPMPDDPRIDEYVDPPRWLWVTLLGKMLWEAVKYIASLVLVLATVGGIAWVLTHIF